MKKITNLKGKILLTAGYGILLCIFAYFNAECIYLKFLNIPCPGCGMSRAILAALRLDFLSAFSYHFMFWSMPVLYAMFLTDGKLFKKKIYNKILFYAITIGFVITWICKIIQHFA